MNVAEDKRRLRSQIKSQLLLNSFDEFAKAGHAVAHTHLFPWLKDNFHKNFKAALFSHLPDEISTVELEVVIEKLGAQKFLPHIAEKQMFFSHYNSRKELKANYLGILEPFNKSAIIKQAFDIIFVPGLAFDLSGARLGRGKGFYDRFLQIHLKKYPHAPLVGIGLDQQIVKKVPSEEHDIKMTHLCTPKLGVIACKGN